MAYLPLSLAERDRRWSQACQQMAQEGLDSIIGFPDSVHWGAVPAEIASLTAGWVGEAAMVFPLAGAPTTFVVMPTAAEGWASAQDWFADVRG